VLRIPTDELKQTAIEEFIRRPVDAVFGNSIHDFAMLEKARNPYAINPSMELEARAGKLGWTIFRPQVSSLR
jgi:phosphoserine phosphatase